MFKLGVATSIAKKSRYSWEHTVDFCTRHNLSLIQFYWQESIPLNKISEVLSIPTRYLHLPTWLDSTISFPDLAATCHDFTKFYESNKLIIHQQGDSGAGVDDKLISQLNALNFTVGIENHHSEYLTGFQSVLSVCHRKRYQIFIVFDIHKFFNRFYQVHSVKEILQAVMDLFLHCRELNLTLVLHIIDSRSFNSDQESWCPVFEGIVPYRQIFNLMKKHQIKCEGLILEYEEEIMAEESLKRLRESII